MSVLYKGFLYTWECNSSHRFTQKQSQQKAWMLAKKEPSTLKEYEQAKIDIELMFNEKYYGCTYDFSLFSDTQPD